MMLTNKMGKTLYHQGDISYFEAVNKETLKNAFQRFHEEGILSIRKVKSGRSKTVCRISPEWVPERDPVTNRILDKGRLWTFIETIAVSRREGKNRRDNASVSTRVLELAGRCGQELFEAALKERESEAAKGEEAVEEKRPRRRRGGRTSSKL